MVNIFVIDTNTLISANLLPGSVSRKAYDKARKVGIAVYSKATFDEFSGTLNRSKFDKYITIERRLSEINAYERTGQLIRVLTKVSVCRDPKDNKFLELAIETGAACIITGDKDLLVLNPFRNIPILTPAEFLEKF
jgi:putative PIN family toxin of toxin-antitoxin system